MKKNRANGEGSIFKRGDGRWVGSVTTGWEQGIQQRKYVYGKTRLEVSKKITETLKAVKDSTPIPLDLLTVSAFADDWLEGVRPSIRPKTYESYESILWVHVKPKLGHIRLAKLTPADLERLYAELIHKAAAPKSVRNYHACIHAMLEKGVPQDILVKNVASLADLPRKVRRDLPMITPEQAKAFLHATREHRLEALFVLAVTTGARQGELLGLTWDNVDLQ